MFSLQLSDRCLAILQSITTSLVISLSIVFGYLNKKLKSEEKLVLPPSGFDFKKNEEN